MKKKLYISICLFLFAVISLNGQTLNELRVKKDKTQKEIEYTNRLLEKTGKTSKATINRLALINEQIKLQEELIQDYNTQINLLQSSIDENRGVIQMMNNDLEKIRSDYARMIQQAYRKRGDYNRLVFLRTQCLLKCSVTTRHLIHRHLHYVRPCR